MWDLIVSVPDHCLSFYFVHRSKINKLNPGPEKYFTLGLPTGLYIETKSTSSTRNLTSTSLWVSLQVCT